MQQKYIERRRKGRTLAANLDEGHWRIDIIEWRGDVGIEWGFDEANGRLIIKGKGQLEDYADGNKACPMKDKSPWRREYERQIRSVVVCYGLFSIGRDAYCPTRSLPLTKVHFLDAVHWHQLPYSLCQLHWRTRIWQLFQLEQCLHFRRLCTSSECFPSGATIDRY